MFRLITDFLLLLYVVVDWLLFYADKERGISFESSITLGQ